jgi:hypothetical protein
MILLAAVIALGFAALAWTMSTANTYVTQYGASAGSSINQLMESVAFEYVFYNSTSKSLTAYVLNCGKIGNVSLAAAYISDQGTSVYSKINGVPLYFLNKTSAQGLNIGQEGYFVLSSPPVTLQIGRSYMIQILTRRGSYFENIFTAL